MSGHNKWSKIKRQKAATDAKKSQTFSKMSKAITIAAKEGGGDPDKNPSLRLAIDKAKEARMPKDNIQRAIDKGTGKGADGSSLETVIYEGYGPGGVAYYVKGVTDNNNRTVADVRNMFNKLEGSLGASGSTAYIFGNPEEPSFTTPLSDESQISKNKTLIEQLEDHDDIQEVYTNLAL